MDADTVAEMSISDLFERFIEATTMRNVISLHKKILDLAELKPCEFNIFFPKYKRAIVSNRQKKNWKAKALFSKIEKRANHKCYSNTKTPIINPRVCDSTQTESVMDDSLSSQTSHRVCANNNALQTYKCLIIGSGPAGLRTAIELQLLGSDRVVIVEKRGRFSRNNVLHLWPFVIDDLKSLGAKKFYGKFCAGSIDHISIRQLQLILLKVCLMVGCDFRDSCSYIGLCPSSVKQNPIEPEGGPVGGVRENVSDNLGGCNLYLDARQEHSHCADNTQTGSPKPKCDSNKESSQEIKSDNGPLSRQRQLGALGGASAHFESDTKSQEKELHSIEWDIIIGADGRRNTLKNFFPRKEFRGRLAIAITANFINRQTPAETSVPEISGLSFIYNQDMFNALAYDTNIELENICYYKDDTHYFVMTAKKRSLLERGVLINDYATTQDLLSDKNVNKEALLKYAKDAAYWTTGLEPLDFALNHYGQEDCAMFDFTSMYAASNACKALRTTQGGLTLVSLVGDSLLEPFWPTGSGCARGFLSSFDAAWMCRQWAVNKCAVLDHHHHGSALSRSSRSRNSNGVAEHHKSNPELTTFDKMALSVIAERESIYRILAQTTSENLQQNYSLWTLNPHTRYPNLNRHLVLPSQVEHLIADGARLADGKSLATISLADGRQRVKTPTKSRRSPKKLKSAGASPSAQPRNARNKPKPLTKQSRIPHEVAYDDYYLRLEESYRDLADSERGGLTQYLSYKRRDSDNPDDIFTASLSGTLPSSHNLSRLEARKARDIDECLKHRRQKTKITYVRDQLISQMRGESGQTNGQTGNLFAGGNAALFNEIKRMREQQSRGVRAECKSRESPAGPLSLLNSMRRCASFAERVKSFESKLSNQSVECSESNASTPRTPIDNVRNLPQFATLQELFVNNTPKSDDSVKKSQMPITKLTKDDWNVKCWENRLALCRQKQLSASTKSLSKSVSMDAARTVRASKPQKQIDVFQDRINQMASKLETSRGEKQANLSARAKNNSQDQDMPSIRAQGWVNHLKRELAKGSESSRRSTRTGQPMNPVLPNKPIKKLFEDEDEDDDGIDVNKHYDHLCTNRPTNKYLSKGAYTSHLARSNVTSKIINRPNPTSESKQAYLAALTSRGSSASSTLSDYSTNTGHSSSGGCGGAKISVVDVECFRCRKFVGSCDKITIGTSLLHRSCLTCADCRITLRSNEIQHYMDVVREARQKNSQLSVEDQVRFSCVICNPDIRLALSREADDRLAETSQTHCQGSDRNKEPKTVVGQQQQRLQSREAFLSSSINYNELYKNILNNEPDKLRDSATVGVGDNGKENRLESKPARTHEDSATQSCEAPTRSAKVTPSPIQVTIPIELIAGRESDNGSRTDSYAEAAMSDRERDSVNSSANDCSEEATLILPPESASVTPSSTRDASNNNDLRRDSNELEMMDEEELQRILHLDKRQTGFNSGEDAQSSTSGDSSSSSSSSCGGKTDDEDSASEGGGAANSGSRVSSRHDQAQVLDCSGADGDDAGLTDDESSSLELQSDTDEYDDAGDEQDMNSTCDDFVTTEEFDEDGELDKDGEPSDSTTSEASERHRYGAGSRAPSTCRNTPSSQQATQT